MEDNELGSSRQKIWIFVRGFGRVSLADVKRGTIVFWCRKVSSCSHWGSDKILLPKPIELEQNVAVTFEIYLEDIISIYWFYLIICRYTFYGCMKMLDCFRLYWFVFRIEDVMDYNMIWMLCVYYNVLMLIYIVIK